MRDRKSPAQLERLLYKESGLLGLSGESADMRALRASGNDAAKRAILKANGSPRFVDGMTAIHSEASGPEVWIVQTDEGSVAASEALLHL